MNVFYPGITVIIYRYYILWLVDDIRRSKNEKSEKDMFNNTPVVSEFNSFTG